MNLDRRYRFRTESCYAAVVETLAFMALFAPLVVARTLVADMREQRRVLIVAADDPADPMLVRQIALFDRWRQAAADRDVTLVLVRGDSVIGAGDRAAALRTAYALPGGFSVSLIGKDGHVAFTAGWPVTGEALGARIDAMPMRRAGRR